MLLPAVPVLFATAALIMDPALGAAQAREVNLEAQAWGLGVSYAFRIAPGHLLGLGVGAAADQRSGPAPSWARRDRISRGRDWVGHIELLTGRLTLAW